MSPVDFKKWSCRPVEFKGQGPPWWRVGIGVAGVGGHGYGTLADMVIVHVELERIAHVCYCYRLNNLPVCTNLWLFGEGVSVSSRERGGGGRRSVRGSLNSMGDMEALAD